MAQGHEQLSFTIAAAGQLVQVEPPSREVSMQEAAPLLRAIMHPPMGVPQLVHPLGAIDATRRTVSRQRWRKVFGAGCGKVTAVSLLVVGFICMFLARDRFTSAPTRTQESRSSPEQKFGVADVENAEHNAEKELGEAESEVQSMVAHLLGQAEEEITDAKDAMAPSPSRSNRSNETSNSSKVNRSSESSTVTDVMVSSSVAPASNDNSVKYHASEYAEQTGAEIPVGGNVGLYFVGSSNVLWMTWIDQLHFFLTRLGYVVPTVPTITAATNYPDSVPSCPDTEYFKGLETARFGRIGWDSWDFAYDNNTDCDEKGFRKIGGVNVRCKHGMSCTSAKDPVRVSDIAEDASHSQVTVLSTFYNDNKQMWSHFACFGGEKLVKDEVAIIAVPSLLRTIRAIHAKNPKVWILIMAKYAPVDNSNKGVCEPCLVWLRKLNERIKEGVKDEPRTLFVDLDFPSNDVEMYQDAHWGHTNCRGSKLMAHAVLDKLYQNQVLTRSLQLLHPLKDHISNPNCSNLTLPACHTSALCWVHPEERTCQPYSVGSKKCYTHAELRRLK